MIKVIMIVGIIFFLVSLYACLVAGKRGADEEISALFEKTKEAGE